MERKFVPLAGAVPAPARAERRIALLPAGGVVWDDFLDTIAVPLERFCSEGPGGWMIGYVDALNRVGVQATLIFFSARTGEVRRFIDPRTGNAIVLLPVPRHYLWLRRRLSNRDVARPSSRLGAVVAPHLSTPVRKLARELRAWGCAAIVCQEYEYFRFDTCLVLGRLMRLPVFATFQGGERDENPLSRALKRFTVRRSAGLLVAPTTEIARVRRVYGARPPVSQVFNPVDVEAWDRAVGEPGPAGWGTGPTIRTVVWHGRISVYQKGLDLLLQAWDRVCAERPGRELRLLLLGAGRDEEEFARLLANSHAGSARWVNEYVTDRTAVRRFLSSGHVFAFPSRLEGFPVAPLEAMACGLPVVATDASGIPDILESGEKSGGIVVPREDVAAFATALGRVLDDPVYGEALARRARARVEEAFSLAAVGRQLGQALAVAGTFGRAPS